MTHLVCCCNIHANILQKMFIPRGIVPTIASEYKSNRAKHDAVRPEFYKEPQTEPNYLLIP